MISLQNQILLVTCLETGAELALLDKKRGTRWLLDPHSLAYGSGVAGRGGRGEPEPDLKPLVPTIDLSRETIEAIKALGFDMAPWSWLNEALPASPEAVRQLYRLDPDGQIMPNWKIDEQQWNWMCYSYIQDLQQQALKSAIPEMTWDHFDVLACVGALECCALDHPRHLGRPAARSEDRQWVRDTFLVDQRAGLMVSNEKGIDHKIVPGAGVLPPEGWTVV